MVAGYCVEGTLAKVGYGGLISINLTVDDSVRTGGDHSDERGEVTDETSSRLYLIRRTYRLSTNFGIHTRTKITAYCSFIDFYANLCKLDSRAR